MKVIEPLKIGDLTAKTPVIQGGMGVGISLSKLAGAVAACGGIGVVSAAQTGYLEPDFDQNPLEANVRALTKEIQEAKAIAPQGIVGVNIMVAMRYYETYVKTAIEAGADMIISGAGLPVDLPAIAGSAPVKLAPIVSTLKSVSVICKFWDRKYKRVPDLVVIEGPEAGGHLGFSMEQLETYAGVEGKAAYDQEIRNIIAHVKQYEEKYQKDIPVVVAGGIYTRADLEHVLELGAQGVQMATRFVPTYECDADQAYKDAYLAATKETIEIVKSPVGMPGRAIHNPFLEAVAQKQPKIGKCHQCLHRCNPAEIPYCITDALVNAAKGDTDHALLFCGSNAYRCEKMEHVADIMKEFEA